MILKLITVCALTYMSIGLMRNAAKNEIKVPAGASIIRNLISAKVGEVDDIAYAINSNNYGRLLN